jgi:Gpi18-like mannosyltransferase
MTLRNLTLSTKLGIIFIAAALVRLAFYYYTDFIADDAFITFRYAENIARGLGFVYNAGERVQGTTTPLFTLVIALFKLLNVPPITAALFISSVASGLTAVIVYRFAQSLRFMRWTLLPVVVYILWPRSLPADTSGMETALFTLLVTAAFYFSHRKLDIYAIGMATLATLTRPEGVFVLGLVFVVNLWERRDRWLSYVSVPLMILVPWLIFSQFYFGSIVPHSITAKMALYSRWGAMSWWDSLVYLLSWHNSFGLVSTVAIFIGAWWLFKKQNWGRLELLWIAIMIAFYALSGSRIFFWYVTPIYPLFALFLAAALVHAADRFVATPEKERLWRAVVLPLVLAVLLFGCYKPLTYYHQWQQTQANVHRAIGIFLQATAAPDDLVAAEDIGLIGYYSRLRVLDRDGLVSPEAVPYNAAGQYLALIQDYRPRWVVAAVGSPMSAFITDSTFLANYRLRTGYAHNDAEYRVYLRQTGD